MDLKFNDYKTEASYLKEFNAAFKLSTGIDNAIPLSRGRLAVYLAIKESITSSKRKVLLSPFTIFDLVNMVIVAGGEPVFIDSIINSPHVSSSTIKDNIGLDVAAVIITHYHTCNTQIEDIANICIENDIRLIEDCAISVGSTINGRPVGTFGDFALFSFGLFKFVSTYFGGALVCKDPIIAKKILKEVSKWEQMGFSDLSPYFIKGIKLAILTNKFIFNILTFPLFRFGYIKEIDLIKRNAQNDPNPFLRDALPNDFIKRPNKFQLSEFVRQLPMVKDGRERRWENSIIYYNQLIDSINITLPDLPKANSDGCINFPIVVKSHHEEFVKELMRRNIDVAVYYYRNCAVLPVFHKYNKDLPN